MSYIHKSRYMIQMTVLEGICNSSRPRWSPFPLSQNQFHPFLSPLFSPATWKQRHKHLAFLLCDARRATKECCGGHSPQVCGGRCPAGQTGYPPGRPASGRLWQRTAGSATGPPWASLGWRSALRSAWGAAAPFVAAVAESDTPPPAAPDG